MAVVQDLKSERKGKIIALEYIVNIGMLRNTLKDKHILLTMSLLETTKSQAHIAYNVTLKGTHISQTHIADNVTLRKTHKAKHILLKMSLLKAHTKSSTYC
jgi:hypothetical protein